MRHGSPALRPRRSAAKQGRGTSMAACGLDTGATRSTTATRAGQSMIRSIVVVRRPVVGSWRDARLPRAAKAPRSLRVRGLVAPNKSVLADRLAGTILSTATGFEEKGRARMPLRGMRALRARMNRTQVVGAAIAAAFSRPGRTSPPPRTIKEQQLPKTSEPFRVCQCLSARGHSQPFCAR